jgi:hypothetical protein
MICWNAPKLAASILGGAPSFTGGDAVSTAGGLAQGALLVGAAAAGGGLATKRLANRKRPGELGAPPAFSFWLWDGARESGRSIMPPA